MDANESSENSRPPSNENNDGTNRHGRSRSYWGLSTAAHAVHGVGSMAKKVVNNRLTDSLWHSRKTSSSDKRENHSHETVDHHTTQPSLNVADEQPISSKPTQEKESVNTTGSSVIDQLENVKPQDGSHDSRAGSDVERLENSKATDVSHVKPVNQHRWPSSSAYGSSTVWPSTTGSNVVDHSGNTKPPSSSHVREVKQHRWPSATSSNVVNQSENSEPPDGSHARLVNQHRWPASLAPTKGVKHSSIVRGTSLTPANRSGSDTTTTRGVSPLPATRGVSPSPATIEASPAPTVRGSSPMSPARGASPTPTTRPVCPLPPCDTQTLTRSSSPSKSYTLDTVSSSQKSGPLDKETGLIPTRGHSRVSPTPTRGVSPTPSRGVSPTPSTGVGHHASDTSPAPVKSSKSSGRRHFFNANILSIFTKIVDNRKEKNVANTKEVAQHLELLYNIQVQWQFANASAEAALDLQRATAEKSLFDVWRAILELRDSLASKKIDISLLILQLKLYAVLCRQMAYIDEWASIQKDHESALFATTSDLQARSLSLPLTGGIKADIKGLKLIVFSTIQVLQATISCIQSALSKLDKTHFLASELANLVLHERALLDECEIFLASAAPLHIEECSLRSYLLQSNRTSMTE